ncbi:MAG: hypothetical protein HY400_03795 [Elusimicrobia bacterium]|nr:hypothetical protein [Elusimicrobiota bacterium]
MSRKFRRFFFALLLLPTVFSALIATAKAFGSVFKHTGGDFSFLIGFCLYPLFQAIFFRPLRLYVLGHELTHALAAALSGIQVRSISVARDSGHVVLSKQNAFVALAPYCIPLYTLLITLVLYGASWFWDLSPSRSFFVGLVGFSLAFHLVLTIDALWSQKQPDITKAGGIFFSLVVIVLANCLILSLALKLFFSHSISLRSVLGEWGTGTAYFWGWAWDYGRRFVSGNKA